MKVYYYDSMVWSWPQGDLVAEILRHSETKKFIAYSHDPDMHSPEFDTWVEAWNWVLLMFDAEPLEEE